jgi:hypothetical protein
LDGVCPAGSGTWSLLLHVPSIGGHTVQIGIHIFFSSGHSLLPDSLVLKFPPIPLNIETKFILILSAIFTEDSFMWHVHLLTCGFYLQNSYLYDQTSGILKVLMAVSLTPAT